MCDTMLDGVVINIVLLAGIPESLKPKGAYSWHCWLDFEQQLRLCFQA